MSTGDNRDHSLLSHAQGRSDPLGGEGADRSNLHHAPERNPFAESPSVSGEWKPSPQSLGQSSISGPAEQSSPANQAMAAQSVTYFVRIPNGQEFGPVPAETIQEWAKQGRVNHTCIVRQHNSQTIIPYSSWLAMINRDRLTQQAKDSHRQTNSTASSVLSDRSQNLYGERFGTVNNPTHQIPASPTGHGSIVMWLGLGSWVGCITLIGGAVCAIIAIVLGIIELGRIRSGNSPAEERNKVWIGLALAIANLVLTVLLTIIFMIAAILSG